MVFQKNAVERIRTANRSVCTVPCVQWAVTMPVMELYRPLPDQECCTEGIVGTATALRVTATGRVGIRRTEEMRAMKRDIKQSGVSKSNTVVKGFRM